MSQEQLSELSGVRRDYIAQLERGATSVPRDPDNLKLLAKALGVRLRDLAEPTGWYDDEPENDNDWQRWLASLRINDDDKVALERIIRLAVEAEERREPTPERQDRPRRKAV